jgi:hypothetical protein
MRHNENSANEDQLGSLHRAVTGAFERKLSLMMEQLEINPEDALFILDERAITAAGNWVLKNEISYAEPEQVANSPLAKKLAEIRSIQSGKTIEFTDESKEADG